MNNKFREAVLHIGLLTVIYCLAHWFLLILSGMWRDDWINVTGNQDVSAELRMMLGLPLSGIINLPLKVISYRPFTFLLFLLEGYLIYYILKTLDFLSHREAFWLSALYMIIPINDARVFRSCYKYSAGLFLFWAAFALATVWVKKRGPVSYILRICTLGILVLAYNTESILLFTLLIALYLYYFELKDKISKRNALRTNVSLIFRAAVKYIDFLIVPVVFYFAKRELFPAYGVYKNYNSIQVNTLPKTIIMSPVYFFQTFLRVMGNFFEYLNHNWAVLLLLGVWIIYLIRILTQRRRRGDSPRPSEQKSPVIFRAGMLLAGFFAFYIGLFPYIVLRHQSIETIDFSGRDSLLLGIGTALILFYGSELFLHEKLREIFYVSAIFLGILFFNGAYMDYQDNYYQQLRFQSEVRHNDILQNARNILYLATIPTYSGPSMNGNSYIASGKLDKYYIDGIEALGGLPVDENPFAFIQTNMTDYDASYSDLDAIVYIDNEVIPAKEILKHKVEELRGSEQFEKWIDESRKISVYTVNKGQSDAIFNAYQNGILTEYNIYTYLVKNERV